MGTAGWVEAATYIENELASITSHYQGTELAFSNQASVSGAFQQSEGESGGYVTSFSNLTNVVLRVGMYHQFPKDEEIWWDNSLLLSAHFDSTSDSDGATNDASGVAVMMEVVRALYQSPPLEIGVVFLFSGGGAQGMLGSQAFVTQHHWARTCRAFIIIGGGGGGGKAMMLRAGPHGEYVARSYAVSAPHPRGAAVTQDMWRASSQASPYRIYRDFGNIYGLDTAWADNGWVYNTEDDVLDTIAPGSLQQAGDNILATVRELASNGILGKQALAHDPQNNGTSVFYDVLGLFMVEYSMEVAVYMHAVIFLLFALVFVRHVFYHWRDGGSEKVYAHIFRPVPMALLVSVLSVVAGFALPLLIALLVGAIRPLQYYSHPWVTVALLSTWSLLGVVLMRGLYHSWRWPKVIGELYIGWSAIEPPASPSSVLSEGFSAGPSFESIDTTPILGPVNSTASEEGRRADTHHSDEPPPYDPLHEEAAFWVFIGMWMVVLFALTVFQFRAAYLAVWWTIWPPIVLLTVQLIERLISHRRARRWGEVGAAGAPDRRPDLWWLVLVLSLIPTGLLSLSTAYDLVIVTVPVMGREWTLVGITVLALVVATVVTSLSLLPMAFLHRVARFWSASIVLCVVGVILFIVAVSLPPFLPSAPLRVDVAHVHNITSLTDSYVSILVLGPVGDEDVVANIPNAVPAPDSSPGTSWRVPSVKPPLSLPVLDIPTDTYDIGSNIRHTTVRLVTRGSLYWDLGLSGDGLMFVELPDSGFRDDDPHVGHSDGLYHISHSFGEQQSSSNHTELVLLTFQSHEPIHLFLTVGHQEETKERRAVVSTLPEWTTLAGNGGRVRTVVEASACMSNEGHRKPC